MFTFPHHFVRAERHIFSGIMFVLSVIVILILFGIFNIIDMYLKDELQDEKGKPKLHCFFITSLIHFSHSDIYVYHNIEQRFFL